MCSRNGETAIFTAVQQGNVDMFITLVENWKTSKLEQTFLIIKIVNTKQYYK
eukprot:UN14577